MSNPLPRADWYPDHTTYGLERWWDGTAWTEATRPRFHQAAPPPPPQPPVPAYAPAPTASTPSWVALPVASPVDFADAIARFFRFYAEFRGTASRSEYWYAFLFGFLISIPLAIVDAVATAGALGWIASVALLIPGLAVMVRRLRDAGFHWAMLFLLFIPLVGPIVVIVLLCQPGRRATYA